MLYFIVRSSDGIFTFQAPWGESMIARPGDAIVRDPKDPKDTYRIAAAAFDCTYEIIGPPKQQLPEQFHRTNDGTINVWRCVIELNHVQ
jgi:hypothetical protein